MEFGLVDFRNAPGSGLSDAQAYRRTLDDIVAAEALGFDTIWLTEHHLTEDAYLPSLLTMAAAVAVRTTRVTIGTAVLLPLHHPLAVAETPPSSTTCPTVGSDSASEPATCTPSSKPSGSIDNDGDHSSNRAWPSSGTPSRAASSALDPCRSGCRSGSATGRGDRTTRRAHR